MTEEQARTRLLSHLSDLGDMSQEDQASMAAIYMVVRDRMAHGLGTISAIAAASAATLDARDNPEPITPTAPSTLKVFRVDSEGDVIGIIDGARWPASVPLPVLVNECGHSAYLYRPHLILQATQPETWERRARLFACDCAERALDRAAKVDPRSREAVSVARRYAHGRASDEELRAAYEAAWVAADAAAYVVNRSAAAHAAAHASSAVVEAAGDAAAAAVDASVKHSWQHERLMLYASGTIGNTYGDWEQT